MSAEQQPLPEKPTGPVPEEPLPAWSLPADAVDRISLPEIWPGEITRDWAWGGATGAGVRICVLDSRLVAGRSQARSAASVIPRFVAVSWSWGGKVSPSSSINRPVTTSGAPTVGTCPQANNTNNAASISATTNITNSVTSQCVSVYTPPTLTKSFNPTSIGVGGTSALRLTLTNPAANGVALTGVSVNDPLGTYNLSVAAPVTSPRLRDRLSMPEMTPRCSAWISVMTAVLLAVWNSA